MVQYKHLECNFRRNLLPVLYAYIASWVMVLSPTLLKILVDIHTASEGIVDHRAFKGLGRC